MAEINMRVGAMDRKVAASFVVAFHYLHRRPSISFAYGIYDEDDFIRGVVTFGTPASYSALLSASTSATEMVIELNRLWADDEMPRNTESWFLSRALGLMPQRIVISYADTTEGHKGFVYRAANFHYSGWTDMDRKTARHDYVTPGKHPRDTFRKGIGAKAEKVKRKPKVKYWITTGNRRERKEMEAKCLWPKMSWKIEPPPSQHEQRCVL